MKAEKAVLWNESGCKEANPKFFSESTCKLNGNMLHYWGAGGFVFSGANSERKSSGTATEDRTGLARNYVGFFRNWIFLIRRGIEVVITGLTRNPTVNCSSNPLKPLIYKAFSSVQIYYYRSIPRKYPSVFRSFKRIEIEVCIYGEVSKWS